MESKKEKNKKEKNSSDKIVKIIIGLAYFFILFLAWYDFYNLSIGNEIGYTLLYFYILLPIITLIASIYVGKDQNLSNLKWLMIIFFSVMYMSPLFVLLIKGEYSLFELFNSYYDMMFNGLIVSIIGMVIGTVIKNKRKK